MCPPPPDPPASLSTTAEHIKIFIQRTGECFSPVHTCTHIQTPCTGTGAAGDSIPASQRGELRIPVRTDIHPWTGCHLPPCHVPRGHEKRGKRSALHLFSVVQKSLGHSPPTLRSDKSHHGAAQTSLLPDCCRTLPPPLPKPSPVRL